VVPAKAGHYRNVVLAKAGHYRNVVPAKAGHYRNAIAVPLTPPAKQFESELR
jgi:hypothetical protein